MASPVSPPEEEEELASTRLRTTESTVTVPVPALTRPGSIAMFPSQGPNHPAQAIPRSPIHFQTVFAPHASSSSCEVTAPDSATRTEADLLERQEEGTSQEPVMRVTAELAETEDQRERDRIREQVRQTMAAQAVKAEPINEEEGGSRTPCWIVLLVCGVIVTILGGTIGLALWLSQSDDRDSTAVRVQDDGPTMANDTVVGGNDNTGGDSTTTKDGFPMGSGGETVPPGLPPLHIALVREHKLEGHCLT